MVPYRLVIAPKFAADLVRIHDEIAKDSPANANLVVDRILAALDAIQQTPHRALIAVQPKGLRHPVRSVAVTPHIVYFRAEDASQVVRVLRVRHGARRPLRRYD
jgi:plasmid stabilization system protein ParE